MGKNMSGISSDNHETFPTDIEIQEILSETAWQRARRDTWTAIKHPLFLATEVFGGPLVGGLYQSWELGLIFMVAVIAAILIFSVAHAPYGQRNDARLIARNSIPDFSLDFGQSKAFIHQTYLGSPDNPCTYVRVLPRPHSLRVMGCSGWLTNIEFQNGNNGFLPTDFTGTDSLQLAWSMRGDDAYDEINLIKGINRYVDVLWTAGQKKEFYLCVKSMPNWLSDLTVNVGTYRITIKVVSANGKSEIIRLLVEWTRNWEELKVREYLDGNR